MNNWTVFHKKSNLKKWKFFEFFQESGKIKMKRIPEKPH